MRTKIEAHEFKTAEGYFYVIYADNEQLDLSGENFFETKASAHETIRNLYHSKEWNLKKENKGFSICID